MERKGRTASSIGQDKLREVLGEYSPRTYVRSVHLSYKEEDIDAIVRQMKTGVPAHSREKYELASSWEDREHLLRILTIPYHEAYHYFQTMVTSFGINYQYRKTFENIEYWKILLGQNGLPGQSLLDFVWDNYDSLCKNTWLSINEQLYAKVLYGSRLYGSGRPRPFAQSRIFMTKPFRLGSGQELPQICVRVNGELYPFGAIALMESWVFSAMTWWVHEVIGEDGAQDYFEKLGMPFFPYKILDYVVRQICPNDQLLAEPWYVPTICSAIAYYALNSEVFDPQEPNTGLGFFPGYRAANLIEMLRDYAEQHNYRVSHLNVLDCAMEIDDQAKWTPFVTNAHLTQKRICAYMSKLTGYGKEHLKNVWLGGYARFMSDSLTTILAALADSTILFSFPRWILSYNSDVFARPPVSLFVSNQNGQDIRQIRVMSDDTEENLFWFTHYILTSIVEQKIVSPTYVCPLSYSGNLVCGDDFKPPACQKPFSSFELDLRLTTKKSCALAVILKQVHSIRHEKG